MKSAVIVGDTRNYHLGSLLNCNSLMRQAQRRYRFLGIFGGKWLHSSSYDEFKRKASRWSFLRRVYEADVVFCNGEGLLEPESPYGAVFFHLAHHLRSRKKVQSIRLVNFTCLERAYGDWHLFHELVPRDQTTYSTLRPEHHRCFLGFDSSVLTPYTDRPRAPRHITVFRGRKNISLSDCRLVADAFSHMEVRRVSAFTKFRGTSSAVSSPSQLLRLLTDTYFVVSSSFHGLVMSLRTSTPFIPVETVPVPKNTLLAQELLGPYFGVRTLGEWLEWYRSSGTVEAVRLHLQRVLPECLMRAQRNIV